MSDNFDSLLERVKRGESLPSEDLARVRAVLTGGAEDSDPYTLIHILWKARDRDSKELLTTFVTADDEMVRRVALQALADLWPSVEVFELAKRLFSMDSSKYVRTVAAPILGEIGRSSVALSREAAAILLDAFDRLKESQGPDWEACYEGLLNLHGVPQRDRPLGIGPLTYADVRPEVINAAASLAKSSGR